MAGEASPGPARPGLGGRLARRLARLALNLGLALAAVAVLEGLASLALLAWDVGTTPRLGETHHTRYDPELGWVNVPSLSLPDMYGAGLSLTTNARGFRSRRETDAAVAPGRVRVVCSGDSFTLGYGVGDDATWCHLLETLDPRLETVNMGQAGYGVDQAYLWFSRDARDLEHQVHLFGFITEDFDRMRASERAGYGKPVLELEGGRLVTRNVPVPRPRLPPFLVRNLESLRSLRSLELLRRLVGRPDPGPEGSGERGTRQVFSRLVEDLAARNRAKGSVLVLLYLPCLPEHASPPRWEHVVEREAERLGVPFLSVAAEFRRLPPAEVEGLFIPRQPGAYPAAPGHLSVEGNRRVAEILHDRLWTLPGLERYAPGPPGGD